MQERLLTLLARLIVLLTAIPVHECAHAYISYKLGDPTAKMMGRLTLNPLKHFDPLGSVCLLVAGVGWAKPVPIDTRYYRDRRKGMALSALAGPVSNFIMAFIAMVFFKLTFYIGYRTGGGAVLETVHLVFYYMVLINVSLGIFNLMPFPPFDGSRIYTAFLPEKVYFGLMKYEQYIFMAVFALLAFTNLFDGPLAAANDFVLSLLAKATFFVDDLAIAMLF